MAISQAEVDQVLDRIRVLLDQIAPLRAQVQDLQEALNQTARDFERGVGEAWKRNRAQQAEIRRLNLLLQAESRIEPDPLEETETPRINSPDPVDSSPIANGKPLALIPPNPLAERKRKLADYIYPFVPYDDDQTIQFINALLTDEQRGVGDMLEILSWDKHEPIWRAQVGHESLDDQHKRLTEWHAELEKRRTYWRERLQALRQHQHAPALEQRQSLTLVAWELYLQSQAEELEAETMQLAAIRRVLEAEWTVRQAAKG